MINHFSSTVFLCNRIFMNVSFFSFQLKEKIVKNKMAVVLGVRVVKHYCNDDD